jgi:hypothetical protein
MIAIDVLRSDEPRKGGSMLETSKRKSPLFALFVLFSIHSMGCVSIQNAPLKSRTSIANCGLNNGADFAERCQLHDRRAVLQRWASQLNPVQLVPSGVSEWASQQPGRCSALTASVHGWIRTKRAEANPVPWPRFHTIPTKPVFESNEGESSITPETYGRFGKG